MRLSLSAAHRLIRPDLYHLALAWAGLVARRARQMRLRLEE